MTLQNILTVIIDRLVSILCSKVIFNDNEEFQIPAIYRCHDISKTEFNWSLKKYMKNKINIKNHCLIGDFNIDILNDSVHDNNSEQRYYITVTSQEFLNNLLEYEYIPCFLGITRPS